MLAGLALGFAAFGLGQFAWFPDWSAWWLAGTGIALCWLGGILNHIDAIRQQGAEVEARRAWIRLHGDPDQGDDPADRR